MVQIRLSPRAEQDLEAILAWTHEQFGATIRLRYEALLIQAILDLAQDANRAGSQKRPELVKGAYTYHLRHSRDHVSRSVGRVRKPRHFLLYRLATDDCLEIGRVLHDSMDLIQHLPTDYHDSSQDSDD